MDKISVIIPVYNVEKYIHQCLDSVINQTYTNLEIILIDDGSTDKSGGVCEAYAKRDKRIKVIHKQNEGVSQARNTGLDICTGDYIAFIDPDDFIQENTYEILMKHIKQSKVDIIVFNHSQFMVKNNEFITKKFNIFTKEKEYKLETVEDRKVFDEMIVDKLHSADFCWNKLYKRTIWEQIRFPYKWVCEDSYVLMDIFLKAKSIQFIPDNLYYYRKDNSKSLTSTKGKMIKHAVVEIELMRAIYFESIYANSKNINKFLYRAYRDVIRYIIKNKDREYKLCGDFVLKQATKLLRKNLPIGRNLNMLKDIIRYYVVTRFCWRK